MARPVRIESPGALYHRGQSGVSHAVRREAPERLRAIAATPEGKLI